MARRAPLKAAGEPRAPTFVSYLRVSTDKQGASGLGLEAQREAVDRHVRSVGGRLLSEHIEIESGKKNDRPEIAKALAARERAIASSAAGAIPSRPYGEVQDDHKPPLVRGNGRCLSPKMPRRSTGFWGAGWLS